MNFVSKVIVGCFAASAVAKHPLQSEPAHVRKIKHGDNNDYSMRLDRRDLWKDQKEAVHRLRQDGDSSTVQTNMENLEYMGPLYMGENQEEVEVVWDTGSDWLVVASYLCDNCDYTMYDFSSESTYTEIGDASTLSYGSAEAEGFNATDLVCTTDDAASCTEMEWFVMETQ
jgi:hypothetical protein